MKKLITFLIPIILVLSSCAEPPTFQPNIDIKQKRGFKGNSFQITNKDGVDYLNTELIINDIYNITFPKIEAGESVYVSFMDLLDPLGAPFPQENKIQSFSFYAETGSGKFGKIEGTRK